MSTLIDLAIRVTALLCIAWLASTLLRQRSASMRATLWTAALSAALLLPIVPAVAPAWRIPILAPQAAPVSTATPTASTDVRTPPAVEPIASAIARVDERQAVPAMTAKSAGSTVAQTPYIDIEEAAASVSASQAAIGGLGLVAIVLLMRIAAGHRRMRRIAARAAEADAVWTALVADVRRELNIAGQVPVRVTGETNVPAVAGVWRPVLLLPIETDDWPLDVRRAVILHELAHIARRDSLGQLVGQIACALYWFVPLAWYGARRAAAFRERASDDVVIAAGMRPSRYAESLIVLARSSAFGLQSPATVAMAESRIHERIAAILSPAARRERLTWRSAMTMLVLTLSATAVVGAIEPAERSGPPIDQVATAVAAPSPRTADVQQPAATTVPSASSAPGATSAPNAASAPGATSAPNATSATNLAIASGPTWASASAPGPASPALSADEPNAGPEPPPAPPQSSSQFSRSVSDVQAPAPPFGRLCGGRGLDKSSSSVQENDNFRRWTVKMSGPGCEVDLRAEGKIEFNPDFTDIGRIDQNGFFRLDVTDGGVRRQLDIESKGGTLTRTWRVDGRERPYDNEARAWFGTFLIELDRRTAVGVDIRLPSLIRQGGVDAVLKETALMHSDYARGQYYRKIPAATKVTPAETIRILKQAGTLTSSAHYLAELVSAYATNVQDATVRTALVELVERMNSDHYQATSIETILGSRAPGPAEMDVLVRLVPKMSSDHYKTQVLLKVLKAPSLSASHRVTIATTSAAIESDHYAGEVLRALARPGLADDAVRQAFFDAATKVGSDHYHGEVLNAVVASASVTERELLDVVTNSKGIGSEHYRAEVLGRVARHQAASDRGKAAVLDASKAMSNHYAEQVRRAAGR
jgi:beta-lactamase regulating signal transducer with metallopeptidase domain